MNRADFIKDFRHRLCCTQREFASIIGVGLSTLQHWEQGNSNVPDCPFKLLMCLYLCFFHEE